MMPTILWSVTISKPL